MTFTRHPDHIPCRRLLVVVDIVHLREADRCANCTRPRPCSEDAEQLDPVGAQADATHTHPSYCRERVPLLGEVQMEAMDWTSGAR